MKGYKVVRKEAGQLWSITKDLGRIEYLLNQKVSPKEGNGPICVFDDEQYALSFVLGLSDTPEVYLAECEVSPENKVYFKCWCNKIHTTEAIDLPQHTALAKSVTLLKRIA